MRIWALFFLFFCSCQKTSHVQSIHGVAMTIPYQITTECTSVNVASIISSTFEQVNTTFNKWNPDSELSQLNRYDAAVPFSCSPQLWDLLRTCDQFVRLSDGKFDPTIEPIEQLWKESFQRSSTPTEDQISQLLPAVGWKELQMTDQQGLIKPHRTTAIDLGSIAKGLAVDMLVNRLSEAGLHSIYVEWGGEVRTKGLHPEGRPWRVGIRSPDDPHKTLHIIELTDSALATSGDYLQYWNVMCDGQTKTFFHVFDPRTGRPLEPTSHSIASVTIQHPSCCVADALATILLMAKDEDEASCTFLSKIKPLFPQANCWIMCHNGSLHRCGEPRYGS